MSRQTNGTDQSLQSGNVDLTGSPYLTISIWLWWDAYDTNDDLALEISTNTNTSDFGVALDPNDGGGNWGVVYHGNVGQGNVTCPRTNIPAAQWNNIVVTIDKTQSTNEVTGIFAGGTSQTLSYGTQSDNTGNWGNVPVFFMSRNNASLFGAGKIAEVGFWNRILTQAEITKLSLGYAPSCLPDGLKAYWPLKGNNSPEEEIRNGYIATVNGATAASHPTMFYPVTYIYPHVAVGGGMSRNERAT